MLSEKVLLCSPNSFNDGLDLVKELGKKIIYRSTFRRVAVTSLFSSSNTAL